MASLLSVVVLLCSGALCAEGGTGNGIEYRAIRIANSAGLDRLEKEMGSGGAAILQKVNRRDRGHMGKGVVLQVPVEVREVADYSPFPPTVEALRGLEKSILVSLRVQAFAAYELGNLVHWGPVCTGTRKQATPAGLYHTNWKARRKVSTINSSWVMPWYFNLHSSMGIAFHQYALPGKPSSYGCIRLLKEDAVWIYRWAEPGEPSGGSWAVPKTYGTPVVIFGEYDYDQDAPWTRLAENPSSADVNRSELDEVLARYEWALESRNHTLSQHDSPSSGGGKADQSVK